MTRKRSKAIDFDCSNPTPEEYYIKKCLYAVSGMYLNFSYNTFVKQYDLDKTLIRKYISGFAHNAGNGRAKEPLIKYLGQYLEPKDFVNLHLVCKPQI